MLADTEIWHHIKSYEELKYTAKPHIHKDRSGIFFKENEARFENTSRLFDIQWNGYNIFPQIVLQESNSNKFVSFAEEMVEGYDLEYLVSKFIYLKEIDYYLFFRILLEIARQFKYLLETHGVMVRDRHIGNIKVNIINANKFEIKQIDLEGVVYLDSNEVVQTKWLGKQLPRYKNQSIEENMIIGGLYDEVFRHLIANQIGGWEKFRDWINLEPKQKTIYSVTNLLEDILSREN